MKRIGLIVAFSFISLLFVCAIFVITDKWKVFWCDFTSLFKYDKSLLYTALSILLLCFACLLLFYIANKRLTIQWSIDICQKIHITFTQIHIWCLLFVLVFVFSIMAVYCGVKQNIEKESTWTRDKVVAHSFGAINGSAYTGSLDAFLLNYQKGFRTFEVDIEMTSDERAILAHDWEWWRDMSQNQNDAYIPTEAEFLNTPIYGAYQPLSFDELCDLIEAHSDIWIVTDTKYTEPDMVERQFREMLQEASDKKDIVDRLIVQIYDENMYEIINDIYPFNNYIFTLYQRWEGDVDDFIQICRWCVEHDISVITMPTKRYNNAIHDIAEAYKICIYVHTENELSNAKMLIQNGVSGIYTDSILREELE